MIFYHGTLATQATLKSILREGLRAFPSHWAGDHFVFASTRVTASPGGDPISFARGYAGRRRANARGYVIVIDVPRSLVRGTVPNDALVRTFRLRAALQWLAWKKLKPPLEPRFIEIVGDAPPGLERRPATVRAFREEFSRARTMTLKKQVLRRYGVKDDELLDSTHTAWCKACLDSRVRIDLQIAGTDVVIPTSVNGEDLPAQTWHQIFRALQKPERERPRELRQDNLTAHIDEDLKRGNVQVLLGHVAPKHILTVLEVSPDGRKLRNELRTEARIRDVLKPLVLDALRARRR